MRDRKRAAELRELDGVHELKDKRMRMTARRWLGYHSEFVFFPFLLATRRDRSSA